MARQSTQDERLDQLIRDFKAESAEYHDLPVPDDTEGKRRILRSLMNVRMPRKTAERTLLIQDEYLTERAEERGIVKLTDIPTLAEAYGIELPFSDILSLWQGDITRLAVDAIVNAANSQMLGCFIPMHSCIDNCIHSFAGVQLRAECKRQMDALRERYGADYEQSTAVPMLTGAYNLPAKKVIHIVGPIVEYALTKELEQDLARCYRNTLELCRENGLRWKRRIKWASQLAEDSYIKKSLSHERDKTHSWDKFLLDKPLLADKRGFFDGTKSEIAPLPRWNPRALPSGEIVRLRLTVK